MSSGSKEEHFFYIKTRVRILFLLTAVMTISFGLFVTMKLDPSIAFSNSNNVIESRTFNVENGDYCRLSIESESNDRLLLRITTNTTSYICVRGTRGGDLKQYNTNYLLVECENWFIVTVSPYQDSQINIEWAHFDQNAEESDSELMSMPSQSISLILVIVLNILSIVALSQSRITIINC